MIYYLKDCETQQLQNFPYCIIGSGAAGITLAIALSRLNNQVLIVETGDWNENTGLDDLYSGFAEPPHPPTIEYRRQRFGGTTHLWGGRCVPMDKHDFELRDHVPNSGWPIAYDDLTHYYSEAMNYCDAGLPDFSIDGLGENSGPMFQGLSQLRPEVIERIERYSLPTDFANKYRKELFKSKSILAILNARCIRLKLNNNGQHLESILVSDGECTREINARCFIICSGGIESTRLLLNTMEQVPSWSRFQPLLGKYYSCHFDLIFGALSFKDKKPLFEFQRTLDGVYARRKLQFSSEFLMQHQLLNSAFRLHFPAYADAQHGSGVLSTIYLAKSILSSEYQSILNHGRKVSLSSHWATSHAKNIFFDFGSVVRFAYDWTVKRKFSKRKLPYTLVANRNGTYPLEFNSEQVLDTSNKIVLIDERDRDGLKRVKIHWKLTDQDIQSGIASFMQLQRLLNSTQQCYLEFDRHELKEQITLALPIGGHHMCTTKMGYSDKDSVVDQHCKLHGVDNLYIASASVFPTTSHANPTLTLVALTLRLANHLSQLNQH